MKSAVHTIRLLRQFADEPELGVNELARRIDIDRASAHRLLQVLIGEGIVSQNEQSKKYRLGLGILDITAGFLGHQAVVRSASIYLERLSQLTGETVSLYMRENHEAVNVACLESRQMVHVKAHVGERIPLFCTSGGLVFLANLDDAERDKILRRPLKKHAPNTVTEPAKIRKLISKAAAAGLGYSDEFLAEGVRSLAAPVTDASGSVIATLTLVAPTQRLGSRNMLDVGKLVRKIADEFSQEISGRRSKS